MAKDTKKLEKKEIRRLKHTFANEERSILADEMARAVAAKHELEDERKSVVSQIGSRITEQDGIINSCAEKLRSGYEFRQFECLTTYDFEQGVVHSHRTDTNELVEDREMRPDERQMELSKEIN